MGIAGAAWAQVAIRCWAQRGLLQVTLAYVGLELAAPGERARGHRPLRCGQQSKSRDRCFLVSGSRLHQHDPLWDEVLLWPQAPSGPGLLPPLLPATIALDQQHLIPGSSAPPGASPTQVLLTAKSKRSKQGVSWEAREELFSFWEILLLFLVLSMSAETQGLSGGCSQSSNYWRCLYLSPVLILHCVITLLFSFILLFSLIWQLPEKPKATQAVYFKIFKICWYKLF